jgi:hypothetical protein
LQVWWESLDFGIVCASTLEKVMEKKVRNSGQGRGNHSREYRALVFDGIWFKKRKQKKEVELVVADEVWGMWEALDTVYPEAKRDISFAFWKDSGENALEDLLANL